jgi:glycosyltransferase involved in cell wall biosynthesis
LKASVYIIVPCFNEANVISQTISQLLEFRYSVIIVDDASTDTTQEIVKKFPIHYLRHSVNLGQGAALQTGILYALKKKADLFVTFDADGQHDSKDISSMLSLLHSKRVDIVFGSRFLVGAKTNISFFRRLILYVARYFNFFLTGILLTDAHNGIRVFNKKAASVLEIVENKMSHATEFLIQVKKYNLKYIESPVNIVYSEYSKKKGQKMIQGFKVLQDILLYKFFR